jgi:hypothetical protein
MSTTKAKGNPAPANRTKQGRFRRGVSGNPNGRPKGWVEIETDLRDRFSHRIPKVVAKLARMAEAGDVAAAKVLLERVAGPVGRRGTDPDTLEGRKLRAELALLEAGGDDESPAGPTRIEIGFIGPDGLRVDVTKRVEAAPPAAPDPGKVDA